MKKMLFLVPLILAGCKTTQEIRQERYSQIAAMDNLELCYATGMQEDFEFWRMLKTEQQRRKNTESGWDITDQLCAEAEKFGKDEMVRIQAAHKEHHDNFSRKMQEAAVTTTYHHPNKKSDSGKTIQRTHCQTLGNSINCTTY